MSNDRKTCSGLQFADKSVFHYVNWDFGYRPTCDFDTYVSFPQAERLQELSTHYKNEP